ncbi:Alpha/Beta hydrolase protein [Elsinoe ampelina]|uniref:Alpha/Beta hydrolase protein n=1 Tax=Elsinoe ampelina TaxID=302913 RepID=A0A6A6GID7_9PEZI|nr:Alpha/Beta hydrolase protein [Elsinoe ampelina]
MPASTCVEIQPPEDPSRTPLFLIHDGGGTIFSYHLLDDLSRPVYGISNPNFETGEPWSSMSEVAELYASFIRDVHPSGHILLGGWSLGGMIAVQIAHLLATTPESTLHIKGLLFIDTPCPRYPSPKGKTVASAPPSFASTTSQAMRDKIAKCMGNSRSLVVDWSLPAFRDTKPPPTVLLKSKEWVLPPGTGEVAGVDFVRDEPDLGWGRWDMGFIKETYEVEGDHYGVFKFEHLEDVSEKVKRACDLLDGLEG